MIFDAAGGDALEAMRCAAAGFLGARLEKFDGLPLPDGTAAADAVATTADPNATDAPGTKMNRACQHILGNFEPQGACNTALL